MSTENQTNGHKQPSVNDVIDSVHGSITLELAWKDIADRESCENSEETVKNYAKTAGRYEETMQLLGYHGPKMAADAVEKLLEDKFDAKILDLGAGTGNVAVELAKQDYTNVDAVDASDDMLKIAAEKKVYKKIVHHFVGDTPIPLEDNRYDLAVVVGVFSPYLMPISGVDEAIRLVRPGGHVVIAFRAAVQVEWLSKFDAHLQRMEEENKWRQVSKTMLPNFFGGQEGYEYVHKVL